MIQIVFKDLERSELAKEVLLSRMSGALEKFPNLDGHRFIVTLSRENSAQQPGPDLFGVKLCVKGGEFNNLVLEKKASNLYVAAAELNEALLERINRAGDRARVKKRAHARKVALAGR